MSSDSTLAKDGGAGEGRGAPARRELRDPQAMRALTHPVRLELLRVLELEGQLTATRAGELIGEPPNTCSFHFRQLAKYGFVEEAGPGPGRSRPWRLVTAGMHFTHLHEDPDTAIAARELESMLMDRYLTRLAAFYAIRSALPQEWQEVTGGSQATLHLTPAELRQVDQEVTAIIDRYRDRITDPARRPAGSQPVEVLLFAYLPGPPGNPGPLGG
jgi:predicted ArsR family transcriptional regulator